MVGDSDPEVIIAGNCWGKDSLAWSFSKDASEVSSPAVGDIDDDGDQEVVLIFGGDSLFVYEDNIQEYAWGAGDQNLKIYSCATLGYLDDNDTLDIVFGLSSCSGDQDTNRVVALQAQGDSLKTLWNKVINSDSTVGAILSPPAIGDVDSDGLPEVIVLSEDGSVYALNGENGDTAWVSEVGVNSASAPVLADFDEDGKLEIVIRSSGDSLFVLKGEDGQKETGRYYALGALSNDRSPAVGDIDGDGDLEVVFQADSLLFLLDSSFNLKDTISIPVADAGVRSPVLADLDDDDTREIVIAAGDAIYILDDDQYLVKPIWDAELLISIIIPLAAEAKATPAIGDIDGDGDVEIICSCQTDSQGIIHVYDNNDPAGEIDWGVFHHDSRRTGCYAQPMLGDTITTDMIWSGKVVIHGDVVVDTGATVTIEPGTCVEFDTTDNQSSGNDSTKSELIVYGTLTAVGTEAESIIFTSHSISPSKSDWYGIVLKSSTSNSSQIKHCQIDYAHKGIYCYTCSVEVCSTAISNCTYGAYVDTIGTKLFLKGVSCDSCTYGIRVQQGALRLVDSKINHNSSIGLYCDAFRHFYIGSSSVPYPDFKDCEFNYNGFAGIFLDDSSPIINYCDISYNDPWGVKCAGGSDPYLGYTTLTNNGGTSKSWNTPGSSKADDPPQQYTGGFACWGTSIPFLDNCLKQEGDEYERGWNVIIANNGNGVSADGQSSPKLGKRFLGGHNSIYDNTDYDVSNATGSLIYAQMNWWGDPNGPDTTKIYGLVDYDYWLEDPPGGKAIGGSGRYVMRKSKTRSGTRSVSGATLKGPNPDSTGTAGDYNELGTLYLLEMKYDEAIEAFQYVLTHFADYPEANYALVHLIHCYKQAGYQAEIVPYLENLALTCSRLELRQLALYMSISQFCREGQYWQALNRCHALVAEGCNEEMERDLRFREGMLYRYGLKDKVAAIAVFQDFIARYPDDPLASIALVELEILGVLQSPKADPEVAVAKSAKPVPKTFSLYHNYPNPFNTQTCIQYDLPKDARVSLKIYNVLGQKVMTLVNDYQHAGRYRLFWGGRNSQGNEVASGIYFIRFEAGTYALTRKMVLLR